MKKICLIFGLIILTSLMLFYNSRNTLLDTIVVNVKEKKQIQLKNFTDFEWDHVLIIYPYSNIEILSKKHSIDLSIVDDDIEIYDNINTLVFIKNKKAVRYLETKIKDFSYRNIDGLIAKENAEFRVIKEKIKGENFIYLEQLKIK